MIISLQGGRAIAYHCISLQIIVYHYISLQRASGNAAGDEDAAADIAAAAATEEDEGETDGEMRS